MYEAGFNVAGFCSAGDLDLIGAAGLQCLVSDASGYDWRNLPTDDVLTAQLENLIRVASKPAALGIFLRDEPDASMFKGLSRVASKIRALSSTLLPVINLFPAYAESGQMKTRDYNEYLTTFVETVDVPLLSYDNYSVRNGRLDDSFFGNLQAVGDVASRRKIPFWVCILASTFDDYMEPSDATLGAQAFAALASGARGIAYYKYISSDLGNFRDAPIDWFGDTTLTYEMVRRLNFQINALALVMTAFTPVGVYHFPTVPQGCRPLADSKYIAAITVSSGRNDSSSHGEFLEGEFAGPAGVVYSLLVNKDLSRSYQFEVKLRSGAPPISIVSSMSGKERPIRPGLEWIAPGAGVLLRLR
jgi:hypothetical protein